MKMNKSIVNTICPSLSSSHCFGAILVHPRRAALLAVALGYDCSPGNGVFLNGYRIQRQADKRVRRDALLTSRQAVPACSRPFG